MRSEDLFKPYSPELRGNLEKYLREYNGLTASNHFFGPEYFFIIKNKGLMIPVFTWLRVGHSPAPDRGYFVNSDYLLESRGSGEPNMSLVPAGKGVYDPHKILENKSWSIYGLKI
jgi:hypothetical protein